MKPDPEKKERPTKHFHPRRLARKVAKKNMDNEGYRKINKNFGSWWEHVAPRGNGFAIARGKNKSSYDI